MARGPEGQNTGGSEGQMVRILDGQKVIWPEDGGWSTVVSGQRVEKREREGFLRSA